MDKIEQLKLILLAMSMTSCLAYSYGILSLPSFSWFRRSQTRLPEDRPKDKRNDGGTKARSRFEQIGGMLENSK